MAARSTNTMVEVLQRFLGDIAQAKTALDADLPFLLQLESMILGKIREPQTQMQMAGLLPPDGAAMAGGAGPSFVAPMMPPGGMSPAGMAPMQGGGLAPMAAAPNADELRRLIQ